jgi:hypothetical protein
VAIREGYADERFTHCLLIIHRPAREDAGGVGLSSREQ